MAYAFENSKEKYQLNFNYKIKYAPREIEELHDIADYITAVFTGETSSDKIPLYLDGKSSAIDFTNPEVAKTALLPFLDDQNMVFLSAAIGSANVDLTLYGGVPQDGDEVPDEWTPCCAITFAYGSGSVTLEIQLRKSTRLQMRTNCLANTSGETEATGSFTFRAGNWYIV